MWLKRLSESIINGVKEINIYTDGGARGNPGPAGAGAIIYEGDKVVREIHKFLGVQTNNFAEYEAVILGLETAKKKYGRKIKEMKVSVKLDSELITKQLNNEYQIKTEGLFSKFIKVHNIMVCDIPNITFTHVRREENKEADRLANLAMDEGTS